VGRIEYNRVRRIEINYLLERMESGLLVERIDVSGIESQGVIREDINYSWSG
jgi:hypothetical protein